MVTLVQLASLPRRPPVFFGIDDHERSRIIKESVVKPLLSLAFLSTSFSGDLIKYLING